MSKIEKILEKYKKSFFSGLYAFMILLTIRNKRRPTYGYEIAKDIEERTNGFIKLTMGTLYPILKKLEKDGVLESRWAESEDGPPRKYYTLTETGLQFLNELEKLWSSLRSAIENFITGDENE